MWRLNYGKFINLSFNFENQVTAVCVARESYVFFSNAVEISVNKIVNWNIRPKNWLIRISDCEIHLFHSLYPFEPKKKNWLKIVFTKIECILFVLSADTVPHFKHFFNNIVRKSIKKNKTLEWNKNSNAIINYFFMAFQEYISHFGLTIVTREKMYIFFLTPNFNVFRNFVLYEKL